MSKMHTEDIKSTSDFFKEVDELVFYTARYSWPSYIPRPAVVLVNKKHMRNVARREGGTQNFKASAPRSYKYALLLRVLLYVGVVVVSTVFGMLSAINIILAVSRV